MKWLKDLSTSSPTCSWIQPHYPIFNKILMLLNTPGWGRMRKNDITPQVHSDNEISHRKRCWLPSIDQQKNVTTLRSSLYELDKETVQLAKNTFTPNCKLNILFPFPGYSFLEQSTYLYNLLFFTDDTFQFLKAKIMQSLWTLNITLPKLVQGTRKNV